MNVHVPCETCCHVRMFAHLESIFAYHAGRVLDVNMSQLTSKPPSKAGSSRIKILPELMAQSCWCASLWARGIMPLFAYVLRLELHTNYRGPNSAYQLTTGLKVLQPLS